MNVWIHTCLDDAYYDDVGLLWMWECICVWFDLQYDWIILECFWCIIMACVNALHYIHVYWTCHACNWYKMDLNSLLRCWISFILMQHGGVLFQMRWALSMNMACRFDAFAMFLIFFCIVVTKWCIIVLWLCAGWHGMELGMVGHEVWSLAYMDMVSVYMEIWWSWKRNVGSRWRRIGLGLEVWLWSIIWSKVNYRSNLHFLHVIQFWFFCNVFFGIWIWIDFVWLACYYNLFFK